MQWVPAIPSLGMKHLVCEADYSPSSSAAEVKNVWHYTYIQIGSGAHLASYPVDDQALVPGLKWQGCEADHSPPSSAKVKNPWSYTSTPQVCPHDIVLN
jgi:hypothetical protein